ncbi:hypothetical protein ODJ79_11320 [Actinoplanes sp. KI2]|uniref:hypothetical protein n=1 Tax=Actinoplanes sp. KI2 TaxID=2983315 RepID=UPI0021D5C933|nr:hypothetical protein [Actinoplanes sp. KI2]MCU7724306.1 hypothetical protein [Actinoplanes sp. KI2]
MPGELDGPLPGAARQLQRPAEGCEPLQGVTSSLSANQNCGRERRIAPDMSVNNLGKGTPMMGRLATLLGAVAVVGLASACAQDPEHLSGAAAPVGTPASASAATPASTPPTTGVPSSAPPASSKPVQPSATASTDLEHLTIYPTHVGDLRVGMSLTSAKATGLITFRPGAIASDPAGCSYADWRGHPGATGVVFNGRYGIRAIEGIAQQHTPQGIKIGSTLSATKKVFPDLHFAQADLGGNPNPQTGRAFADPKPNDGAHYRFAFKNGKVAEIGLASDRAGCYE